MMKEPKDEELKDMDWDIERSIRYHDRQQLFFGVCHKIVMLVATFGGGYYTIAGFALDFGADFSLWLKILPGMAIIALGLLDVVFGFASKEALHLGLKLRWIRLRRQLLSAPDLNAIKAEQYDIEADEPPVLRVLDAICHNEMLRARGYDWSQQIKIGFWQRLLANIRDIQEYRLHSKNN